jgi:hypothetical protein
VEPQEDAMDEHPMTGSVQAMSQTCLQLQGQQPWLTQVSECITSGPAVLHHLCQHYTGWTHVNRPSRVASATRSSSIASDCPTQSRGPWLKGRKQRSPPPLPAPPLAEGAPAAAPSSATAAVKNSGADPSPAATPHGAVNDAVMVLVCLLLLPVQLSYRIEKTGQGHTRNQTLLVAWILVSATLVGSGLYRFP